MEPWTYYRVHKSLQLVPILKQINSVHNFSPYVPKFRFNNILPSMPNVFRMVSSLQVFRQKRICTEFLPVPFMLHIPAVSSFLTWSL
jgi:hypothetical protein